MKYIDITFPTPLENLACDEALLNMCESGYDHELLRFWESPEYFVVLGYSGRIAAEVHTQYCKHNNVPILRRYSGGGTVVQGPGCVNFALILDIERSSHLHTITETNLFVMNRHKEALAPLIRSNIEIQGFSDLAIGSRKFSGNAQRRRQHWVLFHGTILLDFDISLVQRILPVPAKQPPYRKNRTHLGFLTNVNVSRAKLKEAIGNAWDATDELEDCPSGEIDRLVRTRYSSAEWTLRF